MMASDDMACPPEFFFIIQYITDGGGHATVRGILRACSKHFAVNSRELRRMAMHLVLDERTLREIWINRCCLCLKIAGWR